MMTFQRIKRDSRTKWHVGNKAIQLELRLGNRLIQDKVKTKPRVEHDN